MEEDTTILELCKNIKICRTKKALILSLYYTWRPIQWCNGHRCLLSTSLSNWRWQHGHLGYRVEVFSSIDKNIVNLQTNQLTQPVTYTIGHHCMSWLGRIQYRTAWRWQHGHLGYRLWEVFSSLDKNIVNLQTRQLARQIKILLGTTVCYGLVEFNVLNKHWGYPTIYIKRVLCWYPNVGTKPFWVVADL